MPSNIGVAQDAVLKLQVVHAIFDDVADADDTGKLAIAQNRHMAHAMADGMQNGNAEARASMQQYFTDLRARRQARGLSTM